MREGARETGGDGTGDGVGEGSGVIASLYVLSAAICDDGRKSLAFPNRIGTRRLREARRIETGWSRSTFSLSLSSMSCTGSTATVGRWMAGEFCLNVRKSAKRQ